MNIAVELEPKNYKYMQKDPIFMPIREKVVPPQEHIDEQVETISEKTKNEQIKEDRKIDKENKNSNKDKDEKRKQKLSMREKKVREHLAKTCILVQNLDQKDLNKIRGIQEKQIDEGEKQKE